MTTAYTSLLGLALPVTGELDGTWGDVVNNSITNLLDSAIAGTTTLSTDADVTLTTTTGSANTSRQAILLWTANGTTTRNITAPAQSKIYTVINASAGTQSIVLRGAGPTTGVTIVKGESAICAWNGSDFIKISNTSGAGTFTNLTVTGNTILGDASADTVTVNGTVTSNLIFTDNTYDIGASGATRPRTLYLGTSLITPAITNSGLTSGRVVYTTTGGLETSSANLLYGGTDLTVYGLTVGRGAGSVSTNTAVGASALAGSVTGGNNVAIGYQALRVNTSGSGITSVGTNSLLANTTGADNSAFGIAALASNTTGSYNTGIGRETLQANTTASNNTAVGYQAGYSNTTGNLDAFGNGALYSTASASGNAAFGARTLYANTTGTNNSAFGSGVVGTSRGPLGFNTTGSNNSAFGVTSLYDNTTGSFNTAVGVSALQSNTTASNSTAVGYQAGYSNTTGDRHVFIGRESGYSNTTGIYNIAMGYQSLYANTTGGYNSAIGYGSLLQSTTGSYNTALGNQSLFSSTTANYNTAVGHQAGYTNTTNTSSVFVGYQAGYLATGDSNTFVGLQAGYRATGGNNAFLGYNAGGSVTSGSKNTIVGRYDGNQGSLDTRTSSSNIVLSDGDGYPRYVDRGGYALINSVSRINSAALTVGGTGTNQGFSSYGGTNNSTINTVATSGGSGGGLIVISGVSYNSGQSFSRIYAAGIKVSGGAASVFTLVGSAGEVGASFSLADSGGYVAVTGSGLPNASWTVMFMYI